MKRIKDWLRPISQIALLIAIIVLLCVFNAAELLSSIIKNVGFQNSDLPAWLRISSAYGRWPLSTVIFIVVWLWIRHKNKEGVGVLNPDNNIYHDHSYLGYCFCSYFLGYMQCRLKGVPIPMQIKLVTNGVFAKFIIDEGIHDAPKKDKARVTNPENYTSVVNLLISDTYKATKSQLPRTVLQFSTVEIDRSSDDHMRYNSEELVKTVISTIRNLPKTVTELNMFMTTNPTNTYRIAKEALATADRDRIKHIYVFPQEREEPRNFKAKGLKIF